MHICSSIGWARRTTNHISHIVSCLTFAVLSFPTEDSKGKHIFYLYVWRGTTLDYSMLCSQALSPDGNWCRVIQVGVTSHLWSRADKWLHYKPQDDGSSQYCHWLPKLWIQWTSVPVWSWTIVFDNQRFQSCFSHDCWFMSGSKIWQCIGA